MADRIVTQTGKDSDGNITALCGPWGRRSSDDAIRDIDTQLHAYYVQQPGTPRTNVIVVDDTPRYLRSTADKTSANNLDNLPNC